MAAGPPGLQPLPAFPVSTSRKEITIRWHILAFLLVLAVGMVLSSSCTPTSTPTPTPTSTPTPTPVSMPTPTMAEDGDSVSVHYTGTLNDGSTFDSSVGRDPLQFTIGQGQMIPGFENAVLGMQVGEKKTVRLKPAEAYGPHQENRVLIISRNELSEGMNPAVGDRLQMQTQSGGMVVVVVIETNEETVTIDGNHPLAGKALNFEIELVAIN